MWVVIHFGVEEIGICDSNLVFIINLKKKKKPTLDSAVPGAKPGVIHI